MGAGLWLFRFCRLAWETDSFGRSEFNAKAQRRKDAKRQRAEKRKIFIFVFLRLCVFAPLVRQAKPDLARQLEGVDHVNCPFDM